MKNSIFFLFLVFGMTGSNMSLAHDSDERSDLSRCERILIRATKDRKFLIYTPPLPMIRESNLEVTRVESPLGTSAYVFKMKNIGGHKFPLVNFFEFWLIENIFKKELNHALKVDRVFATVSRGPLIGNPVQSVRIIANHQYISNEETETFLKLFVFSIEAYPIVEFNSEPLQDKEIIAFLKSLPNGENFYDHELLNLWKAQWKIFYRSQDLADRLFLTQSFFVPKSELSEGEKTVQHYLFQGNLQTREATRARLLQVFASWLKGTPAHLDPRMGQYDPTVKRALELAPEINVSAEAKTSHGNYLLDARHSEIDPHPTMVSLGISDETLRKLNLAGFYSQDQLNFYPAERLVDRTGMDRAELIELADTLFFEAGIFLKFDIHWDYRHWRILKDRTYLRMPKRTMPKDGVDRSPSFRSIFDFDEEEPQSSILSPIYKLNPGTP